MTELPTNGERIGARATGGATALATMRAQLKLAGYSLHTVDGGSGAASYLVSRWAMSRPLADLHAVRQFMRQVGAGQ